MIHNRHTSYIRFATTIHQNTNYPNCLYRTCRGPVIKKIRRDGNIPPFQTICLLPNYELPKDRVYQSGRLYKIEYII